MKKIFIIVILLNTFTVFSQKFELTPHGFVDSEDHSKNYIVIEFASKTKEELFNETMIYLTKNYVSASPKEDLELFASQFVLSYKLAVSDEKNEDW